MRMRMRMRTIEANASFSGHKRSERFLLRSNVRNGEADLSKEQLDELRCDLETLDLAAWYPPRFGDTPHLRGGREPLVL